MDDGIFPIATERLNILPFDANDGAALAGLMNDAYIANMMTSIGYPFPVGEASDWIAERGFHGELGFCVKVTLKDGTMIGFIGIGGDPVNTAYAFGRTFWGKGYATEAMRGFLGHVMPAFGLTEVTAGAMFDNAASQNVLTKLGFEKTGEDMHKTSGRLEEAVLFLYRLRNAKFGTS